MRGEMNLYRFEISNQREKILLTWSFISATFQNDSIFWWTCVCRHFISVNVYMIFYHSKWNFISDKVSDMKSIPALSFKCTYALIATSNESALIHCVYLFRLNYVHMKISCRFEIFGQNDQYEVHTVLSFISAQFMWT